MNTAVRAAVRIAMDRGHEVLGVQNGFAGLLADEVDPMGWMSVHGWVSKGGAELGVSRKVPEGPELHRVAERIEQHGIDALLIIGGLSGYRCAHAIVHGAKEDPRLRIPVLCLPASINNNLPGTEYSIGSDTALNSIVADVDKIKQSAVASHRCFIVEVMGRRCGYLALMSGLATGAERVYLPEDGISLKNLASDVTALVRDFKGGKRLGLLIRNEQADEAYTTDFIARLFAKEGEGMFDVRTSILGHVQQGGNPTPYDRIQAIRLSARSVGWLLERLSRGEAEVGAIGLVEGRVHVTHLDQLPHLMHPAAERPRVQWWESIRPVARAMCEPQG